MNAEIIAVMEEINEPTAQCAHLKIVERRSTGVKTFRVTIQDKVQRDKFQREIKDLTKELSTGGRSCTIIMNNQPQ